VNQVLFKKPLSILLVIHTTNLRVLLIERAAHPGYWQSVTGSQEDQESLLQTAYRELAEETGIQAAPGSIQDWHITNRYEIFEQWRHRYAPDVTHNTEHVFSLCLPESIEVQLNPQEHRAQCWLPWQEAARKCFSWSNQDAILMLPRRPRSGV
jgi:dATP pyrophosphohydrolase